MALSLSGCSDALGSNDTSAQLMSDNSDGDNWPGYGRTYGEQHFSPLHEIDQDTVEDLGLAWSMDLPLGNTNTQPIAIDGVLYFATGLSIVHAVDAKTGKELWQYDPQAGEKAGMNLRFGWGVRGIAWWNGKIFTGTQDGRLIALNAKTGQLEWSQQTFPPEAAAYISGAPRAFDGKVIIGFGGTTGPSRGYVTAYDAETGKQLWRFWTVPGDPSKGFENKAMEMAAKTWSGEWWKFGGGGDVWNSIAYDAETDTVFIGVGSGYPWNQKIRSEGKGDNLFTCSIVALDGKTGEYKWHYQTVPGETWDYDSAMDIELADLEIDGKQRKVIVHAPKNGFFYVIDRITGKLISAEPFVPVTWATGIDKKTGRPIEAPGVRFPDGKSAEISPNPLGGHNWIPMAFSPQTGLAYIPAMEFSTKYSNSEHWEVPKDRSVSGGIDLAAGLLMGREAPKGKLIAWSPVEQKKVWEVDYPTHINGGVLATGGKLVFQGTIDGFLTAYAADTGKALWRFDAQAPIQGTPISYEAGGQQYVSVLTGLGMNYAASAVVMTGMGIEKYDIDPRSQARRVLTFTLGADGKLPPSPSAPPPPDDPDFVSNTRMFKEGAGIFNLNCGTCHGVLAIGITQAPDLRRSPITYDADTFRSVVHDGALESRGMPPFPEFSPEKTEAIRHYIRAMAAGLRKGDAAGSGDQDNEHVILH